MNQLPRRAALLFAISLAGCATDNVVPAKQVARSLDVTSHVQYLLYTPPTYATDPLNKRSNDGRGWPLVVFLGGSGECGTDLEKVKNNGLPKLVAAGRQFPFVLLSPQTTYDGASETITVDKLIDVTVHSMHIDPDRVYLTGLSLGGYGTWNLACYDPSRFAAIAPMSGWGDPEWVDANTPMKSLPVWAFHGGKDNLVPLQGEQDMIDAFRKTGNPNVELTVYADVGHGAWNRAYDDPAFWNWLLAQRRGKPATQSAK